MTPEERYPHITVENVLDCLTANKAAPDKHLSSITGLRIVCLYTYAGLLEAVHAYAVGPSKFAGIGYGKPAAALLMLARSQDSDQLIHFYSVIDKAATAHATAMGVPLETTSEFL